MSNHEDWIRDEDRTKKAKADGREAYHPRYNVRRTGQWTTNQFQDNVIRYGGSAELDKFDAAQSMWPTESQERTPLQNLVRTVLEEDLKESHRQVLDLYENQGYSQEDIAKIRGCSQPAVKTLLDRARNAFKKALSKRLEALGADPII